MTKDELKTLALGLATIGRKALQGHPNDFVAKAIIVTLRGEMHIGAVTMPLHGRAMAEFIAHFANFVGGQVDAVVFQSDARMKKFTEEEFQKRTPSGTDIAGDTNNPECLLTAARSREHVVFIRCEYTRTRIDDEDLIAFATDEPEPVSNVERIRLNMLPNLWSDLN